MARIVKTIALVVNVALYILFIIVVFVFQFATQNKAEQCGGRVTQNLEDITTTQKNISIGLFCLFDEFLIKK
jgi:hypothetical protein